MLSAEADALERSLALRRRTEAADSPDTAIDLSVDDAIEDWREETLGGAASPTY